MQQNLVWTLETEKKRGETENVEQVVVCVTGSFRSTFSGLVIKQASSGCRDTQKSPVWL